MPRTASGPWKKPAPVIKAQKPTPKPNYPESNDMLLLTGGIGDVIAVETFTPKEQRHRVTHLFYATRKWEPVREMFQSLPNYSTAHHVLTWTDFEKFWCFFDKRHVIQHLAATRSPIPSGLTKAVDTSIGGVFPKIKSGSRKYAGSSLMMYKLTEVGFDLPAEYAVVCPYSNDKRDKNRDFDDKDWKGCIGRLSAAGLKGIVINSGPDVVPESEHLINFNNMTTFPEAVEILKKAKQYIGIDSCLSILAAQVFTSKKDLVVKTVNKNCVDNAMCYFAPHGDFPFLVQAVE